MQEDCAIALLVVILRSALLLSHFVCILMWLRRVFLRERSFQGDSMDRIKLSEEFARKKCSISCKKAFGIKDDIPLSECECIIFEARKEGFLAGISELESREEVIKAVYENLASVKKHDELMKELFKEKRKLRNIRNYLANEIPHDLINEATNKLWKML